MNKSFFTTFIVALTINSCQYNMNQYGEISCYTFLGGIGNDRANAMQQTADGGYIVAGQASADIPGLGGKSPLNVFAGDQDFLVVKLTATGAVSWYTFLGGSGVDQAAAIHQTTDGGYIVTGVTNADIPSLGGQNPLNAYASGNDALVVKLTAAGVVSWYTFLGGSGNDPGSSIQQTTDGGYIVLGYVNANIPSLGGQSPLNAYAGDNDVLVVKLTAAGTVDWYTFLGGAGTDQAWSVQQTADGGYIVAGRASTNIPSLDGKTPLNAQAGTYDFFVVKLTDAGAVSWYTFLGGSGIDIARSIQQTVDGGYIVAGHTTANIATLGGKSPVNAYAGGNMFVVKLTGEGGVSWYTFLDGTGTEAVRSIQQTTDGGYIMAGFSNSDVPTLGGKNPLNAYIGGEDIFVAKLTGLGVVAWYTFLGGNGNEAVRSIQQTTDGGYIMAGYSNSNITSLGGQAPLNTFYESAVDDMLVIKLKADGGF